MFLNVKLQRLSKSHHLQCITSSKDSEKLEKALCVRYKAEDLCWMPVVFRPSDDTASLIGMILSLTLLNGAQEYFQKPLSVNTICRAICRCQLKLYHAKRKSYVNMVQKRHRVLWAKAHLKWTVSSGKVFYGQTSPNLTFLLEITDAVSSGLKREGDLPAFHQRSVQKPASLMVWGCISGWAACMFWKALWMLKGIFHKTIRIYPNQKPWINSDVRAALSAWTSVFKSGNFDDRKQASYDLRKSIKAAKRQYKNKVEEQFNTNNTRSMWQGINNITDFKGNKPATVNIAASLPDELNHFYARFEAHNTAHTESAPVAVAKEAIAISISVADVTRSFRWVNIHKAVGPDGIPGRVLRACTFQLARVFTDFFNLSLSLSVVPLSSKKSTIVPIPKKK